MTSSTTVTYAAALDEAIAIAMREDDSVLLFSTTIGESFVAEFGPERARTTPISEPAVTGLAVGAAAAGKRPVVNWRNITFAFNSFDQIANQAAKLRYMFGGQVSFPIVFRAMCGGGMRLAAQHSQSPHSIYAHIAGLKVIVPSSPQDAMGLMAEAIRDPNPVLCLEPARLATMAADVPPGHRVPIGSAAVRRPGTDVTLLAVGYMVELALRVAEDLQAEGISVEVLDPRTISPLDTRAIRESVRRTGRLVVADEAPAMCSFAAEALACVTEDAATFARLAAPPTRVCGLPVPVPFSAPLEDHVLPDEQRIADAIRATAEHSASPR